MMKLASLSIFPEKKTRVLIRRWLLLKAVLLIFPDCHFPVQEDVSGGGAHTGGGAAHTYCGSCWALFGVVIDTYNVGVLYEASSSVFLFLVNWGKILSSFGGGANTRGSCGHPEPHPGAVSSEFSPDFNCLGQILLVLKIKIIIIIIMMGSLIFWGRFLADWKKEFGH